jgi:hypothetical protein
MRRDHRIAIASTGSTNASPIISVPAVRRSNCIASNYIPRRLTQFALARLDTYGSGRIVGDSYGTSRAGVVRVARHSPRTAAKARSDER